MNRATRALFAPLNALTNTTTLTPSGRLAPECAAAVNQREKSKIVETALKKLPTKDAAQPIRTTLLNHATQTSASAT